MNSFDSERGILLITHLIPFPPSAGNSFRILKLIAWLRRSGWKATLLLTTRKLAQHIRELLEGLVNRLVPLGDAKSAADANQELVVTNTLGCSDFLASELPFQLRRKLTSDGHMLANVPKIKNWSAVSELLMGGWTYSDEGSFDRTYLSFFTRRSFSELLWNVGYRIQSTGVTRNERHAPYKLLATFSESGYSPDQIRQESSAFSLLEDATVPSTVLEPRVAVIVLNWNGMADTIGCVQSLLKLDYRNVEIIIVDNGSTDGSTSAIRTAFPGIEVVETGCNKGYAGGNNVGIRIATERDADYVLILNNDTLADPGILKAFVRAAGAIPEAGIFGAKIFHQGFPGRLWFAGAKWCPDQLSFSHIGGNQPDAPEFDGYRQWDYITGCALFIDKRVFSKVGLFDENFFLTYEDTDWCYRARQSGFLCVFAPEARVWHKVSASFGGATSPLITYFLTRNKLLWARKHLSRKEQSAVQRDTWRELRNALVPRARVSETVSAPRNYYWAAVEWTRELRLAFAKPSNRAMLYGLRDYYFRRFGDCPACVRKFAATR